MSPDLKQRVRLPLDRARSILDRFGAAILLRSIYDGFVRVRVGAENGEALRAALRELKASFAALAQAAPLQSEEWLALARGPELEDDERVLVAAAALSRLRDATQSVHQVLAEALGRMAASGIAAARAPCLLHALLALLTPDADPAAEPLARAIIARELRTLAPGDAVRQGREALARGFDLPYRELIAAGDALAPEAAPEGDAQQRVQSAIERAKPLIERFGPELALRSIYDGFTRAKLRGGDAEALGGTLRHMKECLAALASATPPRTDAWFAIATALGLNDIERILVAAAALSRMPQATVWTHYFLTESLNRLVLSGVADARFPCVLHALLTLLQPSADRAYEPLPRAVLARELRGLAPHDAARHGIEALRLGSDLAYHHVIAAARNLGAAEEPAPARPEITYLKALAARCGIASLRRVSAVRTSEAAGLSQRTVIDAETRITPPPAGDSDHYVFRSAGKPVALPAISVYEIRGGTVSFDGDRRELYVFDGEERCIGALSSGLDPFVDARRHRVAGALAVLGDQFAGPMNICHFLLDHFSRIAAYQRYTAEPFFCLLEDHGYYQEIARLAGFGDRVVRPEGRRYSVTADALLVSSNIVEDFRHPGHLCASWALDFLKRRLQAAPAAGRPRKLYISRADARGRKILNEAEMAAALARQGFETVALGRLGAARQIELFQSATHVVGVHGAGLTNLLFAPQGTKVLEILPPLVATPDYWLLCSAAGHRYRALIAEDPEFSKPLYRSWTHHPEFNDRNLVVPLAGLSAALRLLDERE